MHEKKHALSLGGSIIFPPDGINTLFLKQFEGLIRSYLEKGHSFVIVCGGGSVTRQYQKAAREIMGERVTNEQLNWLGVHSIRLNGYLLQTLFADVAAPIIVEDYEHIDPALLEYPIVIGAAWKPGFSSDYDSVILADSSKVSRILNLSNVKQVFDKDPKMFPDAKAYSDLSWDEYLSIIGTEWQPGQHSPFDPLAAQLAKEKQMTVVMAEGTNLETVQSILDGNPFTGTIIHP